nr:DNA translocase FtsK [Bacillus sp. USDA818B3_A]
MTELLLLREHEEHVNDSVKDLDTRIAYQYPKGSSSVLRTEQLNLKQDIKRVKRLPDIPKKETKAAPPKVKPEKQKKIHSGIMDQKSRPRGPFQPTEIPSPVFGFNRPPKTTATVEHELSRFFSDEAEERLASVIETKHTIKAELAKLGEVSPKSERKEHQTIELRLEVPESPEKDPVQPAAAEVFPFEKSVQAEASTPILVSNNQIAAADIVLEEQTQADAGELIFVTDDRQFEEKRETEEDIAAEAPPAIRSRLPFNVMMLKQDRQKLEERKRKRELAQKQLWEKAQVIENSINEKPVVINEVQYVVRDEVAYEVQNEVQNKVENDDHLYALPKSDLLSPPVTEVLDTAWIDEQSEMLNRTLQNFNVGASVVNVTQGPSVTRFEVQPEPGVKVNKITNLSDDIKLSLAARDIRMEAPIPGKHTIGIEVPNQKSRPVLINEIIGSSVFKESASPLTAVLGLDIAGKPIVTDLKKMPHGLIAGATGSGKSVCINSILISLLYKARPDELKLLLIDPKMVELAPYNRIPHLVSPVITDVKAATAALKWAVEEMERRYELFAHTGVRDINRFNELAMQHKRYSDKLPFIVIIIDELADLMMMSPADVEEAICRIAQKARACGIHLIVATQRPSVDVITGLIKANIPTRVAFSVSSQVDSRTIIDISGAERLLGRGDMLFLENGASKPVRLQGTFVSDEEIDVVVAHVREQQEPDYLFEQEELLKKAQVVEEEDELFYDACEFIVSNGGASTSSLQRRFKIGYNRAARLMDMLEQNGYITGANGSKPREVLITEADLEAMQD